ncbi:MAG: flagellar motor switch protein FliM [Sulfobacillus acidophilus]|uniref:Flagellar motor switch protein FliM n=1 Tax=Sulfobacillus acidophilus TaxID=53633 RepID=A0A2T2WMA7_9FIRM|nr:MAG: flagellar motor switch protein FliM [Sulfobacillus acidophilus]
MGLVRDHQTIRPYDFQRPHQLSRGQLDAVTSITATFWRSAANFLSTYLRTPVQLQQLTVQQIPYEEMIAQIRVPAVLGLFQSDPLPGSALIECTPGIAVAMIDRALGGQGAGVEAARRLSEIEQTIVRRIFDRVLVIYGEIWKSLLELQPKLVTMEHNPAFAQIAGEGDLVLISKQQVTIDANRGQFMLVWPYMNIAPLAEAAVRAQLIRDGSLANVELKREDMQRHVESVSIQASVLLGKTELTLGEFDQLKVGDAIILKNRYDQPLTMRLSTQDKFLVLPGRVRGQLAVRVISRKGDE